MTIPCLTPKFYTRWFHGRFNHKLTVEYMKKKSGRQQQPSFAGLGELPNCLYQHIYFYFTYTFNNSLLKFNYLIFIYLLSTLFYKWIGPMRFCFCRVYIKDNLYKQIIFPCLQRTSPNKLGAVASNTNFPIFHYIVSIAWLSILTSLSPT